MAHVEDRWKRDGRRGTGLRWRARYVDPDGAERSRSFARKADADRFLAEVEHGKNAGTYRDPDAGKVTLRRYADGWLAAQTFDEATRDSQERRLRLHVYPALGDLTLRQLAAPVGYPGMGPRPAAGAEHGGRRADHAVDGDERRFR